MDDARYFIHHLNESTKVDSLQLLEVRLLLDLRREKEAAELLGGLNLGIEWKCCQILLANHSRLMSSRYDSLNDPSCAHDHHREQWKLQLLAQSLLQKKMEQFDMVFNASKCAHPIFSVIEFALYVQKQDVARSRKKSPFLAGVLSTMLPGSGKLYAGKPREALFAFLPVAFNLAQAGEGYYYNGVRSPHLYVFGGLGTLFYASNIYGSARTAKRKNDENDFIAISNIEFEIAKLTKYY